MKRAYFPAGADIVQFADFVKKCYALSRPQGLGMLHYQPGEMSDELAEVILRGSQKGQILINMDYVVGRAVKMVVFREPETDRYYIHADSWYDHTDDQLAELIEHCSLTVEEKGPQ